MRIAIVLVLALMSLPGFAASKKYVTMPSNSSVLTSSNTAYLSEKNLWVPGNSMSSYIERLGTKTPIGGLVPKKAFSVASIGSKFKTLAKGNFASIAMSAAISAALAGVGWIMDEGSGVVMKKGTVEDGAAAGIYWIRPYLAGNPFSAAGYGLTASTACADGSPYKTEVVNGICRVYTLGDVPAYDVYPMAKYTCASGVWFNYTTKACDPFYDPTKKYTSLSDSDYDAIDPFLEGQGADWLKQLLSDMCTGSLKPAECFTQLQVASQQLTGPASVQGSKSSTTTYRNNADGTTSTVVTETDTTFDLDYGPDYFTANPKTTTSTKVDGTTTETSTTQDSQDVTDEQGTQGEDSDDDKQEESAISGMSCDAVASCSGDAIQCAIASTDKDTYCLLDKFATVDSTELQTQVTGDLSGADYQKFSESEISKTDLSNLIDTSSTIGASCPVLPVLSVSVFGKTQTFDFAEWLAHLCEYASWYGAFLVIFAMRNGVEIIARGLG